MKQVLTIVIKLQPSPEQVAFLEATLQAFADACNYVNEHTAPKLTNKIAIQSLTYQTIKNQFNLVANMAVRACARVAANRKVACSKGKPVKGFIPSRIDCDKDLFRLREHDWTVSLSTVHGRERVKLKPGNYQKGKLKGRKPTSAQLCKHRDGQFYLHIQIKNTSPDPQNTDKVIGIDLGRRDIAVTSEDKKWDGLHIQSVHGDADFNGANNIALVGLSINQPGGTGLSCKLSQTVEYVQLGLFDDFRATENPDLCDSRSG
ncbi:MAG: hypothetical protein RIE73_06140 [Coleofasciculus sp. C1-SOL-03]|uniref:hypothetical protein n=1 Tax=Coleofasciculus sp. C1-SOL-03 TaxID=3069522 RepID=UPI0032FB2A0D